jgi:hypothetical protein
MRLEAGLVLIHYIYIRLAEKVITCFPAVCCDRKWLGGLHGKGAKCSESLADR